MENFFEEFGGLFGGITLLCVLATALRAAMKKYYKDQTKKGQKLSDSFMKVYNWVRKNHRTIGLVGLGAVLLHLTWQVIFVRLSFTGVAAAVLLIAQTILGFSLPKHKGEAHHKWANAHQVLGIVLVVTVLSHLAFKL